MNRMRLFLGVFLVSAFLWQPAGAAGGDAAFDLKGIGIRGGLSVDPDQIFFGTHLNMGDIVEGVRFAPNITLGFGDDITIIAMSPDIHVRFPIEEAGDLYVGGLLTLQWIHYDKGWNGPRHEGFDDTRADVGIHIFGGWELQTSPFLIELTIGLDDTPDLKAAVGYTFRTGR